MTEPRPYEQLIHTLGTELTPVRRLRSPAWRTLGWLALIATPASTPRFTGRYPVRITAFPSI